MLDKIINEEKEDYNKYIQSKNNKKEKKKEEELSIPKIKYFLITEIYLNEKYGEYLKTKSIESFFMKQNDKSKEENDIIKCEYNLYYLLNNFIQLEKSLFDENEIKSAEKILNELHFSLSKLEIDDEYLSKISVEYLLEYLRRFPEDSRENNFEKIRK